MILDTHYFRHSNNVFAFFCNLRVEPAEKKEIEKKPLKSKDVRPTVSPSRSRQSTRKTETENVPSQVCDGIFQVGIFLVCEK